MRVRPFFWCLLVLCCTGVLIFAATIQTHAPAMMQVRIDQSAPVATEFTTVKLHLADVEGVPIEDAQVVPSAWMTNMKMAANSVKIKSVGRGDYVAQLQLYMAGPWAIRIVAHADGFDALEKTLLVQVE